MYDRIYFYCFIQNSGLQALEECVKTTNVTITSLNTGGNVGTNDAAEKIANSRQRNDTTQNLYYDDIHSDSNNNDDNGDRNSIYSADYSDTDSEGSRSKSPNPRNRLGMNGRR